MSEKKTYAVGTLRYTVFGLSMLFFWLLWGDFISTLLDGCIPSILPLKLKDLGADDKTMVLLNRTLAYGITFVFAPMVSFNSDRHRGRWGRRIPYLAWSTPFVGICMVLVGCYGDLVHLFMGDAPQVAVLGFEVSRKALTLILFGALFVGFDFANIFAGTVYWYLFNDVVPERFLSRFLSLFRMVGIVAGMIYSKWIFPHSLDHFRLIFVAGGIAYVAGFLLICIFSNVAQCVYIFRDFGPATNLVVLYAISFLFVPFNAVQGAAEIPMYMRLLPKERYGQFCSANAMLRSFAMIFGSIGAAFFMDGLRVHFHMGDWRYRCYPIWNVVFQAIAIVFLFLMYREWKARGGDKGYTPPEA